MFKINNMADAAHDKLQVTKTVTMRQYYQFVLVLLIINIIRVLEPGELTESPLST